MIVYLLWGYVTVRYNPTIVTRCVTMAQGEIGERQCLKDDVVVIDG